MLLVGNETLLRADLNEVELMVYLDFIREFTKTNYNCRSLAYLDKYPEIGNHVDFVTVHFLPYWENVPIEEFNSFIIENIYLLRKKYPNKKITIGRQVGQVMDINPAGVLSLKTLQ